jgi:hypothetical protein
MCRTVEFPGRACDVPRERCSVCTRFCSRNIHLQGGTDGASGFKLRQRVSIFRSGSA